LTITVSIGIAALPDPMIVSPTAMINAADECLYRAKQHGRNCVINKR
jgi:diguanylate cyclase (GGDEF)-like protein